MSGNFKVLSKLNDHFLKNIKTLWIIKSGVFIVTKDDNIYVFGKNNFGCLGLGHENSVHEPTIIEELSQKGIKDFANGCGHVIAYNRIGQIYCWGRYMRGDLDFNTTYRNSKPSLNEYLTGKDMIEISCGSHHLLALSSLSEVYAWGSNCFGQLGNGCNNNELKPKKVYGLDNEKVIAVSCGSYHSMALTRSGHVFSWGSNKFGQLGTGKSNIVFNRLDTRKELSNIPKIVTVKDDGKQVFIKKIACGSEHSILLSSDGDVYAFGNNRWGQLGLGLNNNKSQNWATKLNCQIKFIDIAAHFDCTLSAAISEYGVYYVWGKFGKLIEYNPKETDLKSFNEIFVKFEKITYKPMHLWHDSKESFLYDSKNPLRNGKYSEEFDEYKIIGLGNFGTVCSTRNKKMDEIYAVKKIPLINNCFDAIFIELKTMFELRNDYVVNFYSAWIEKNYHKCDGFVILDRDKPFLLHIQMELYYKTLKDTIKQLNNELNQKESDQIKLICYYIASELFKEILEGVDYLHKQNPPFIHKNLKSTNVFITSGISGRFVRLGGFGLKTVHEHSDSSNCESTKYMSPKLPKRKYDSKTDILSLGVIVEELFNIDIEKSSIGEKDFFLRSKYSNLLKLAKDMTSTNKDLRPNSDQILLNNFWAIELQDCYNAIGPQTFNSYFKQVRSIDESFHKYFIQTKLKLDNIIKDYSIKR